MLTTQLLHPEMLDALARSGHGGKVLVADGNYPFGTGSNPAARKVYLNLTPGVVDATTVLAALTSTIPIESAEVMGPDDGSEPPIFAEFRDLLPGLELTRLGRFAFYDAARTQDVALVVATAERRIYANILLTIGVRAPGS